jgi:succinate dehydrogenase assembly factor 2
VVEDKPKAGPGYIKKVMAARLTKSFRVLPSFRPFIRTISTRDPFPLPLSPEVTDARRFSETETPLPPRTLRENETIAAMRSRLVYQSRKRGMLEGDLLLSTFATENLSSMSEKELIEYDRVC